MKKRIATVLALSAGLALSSGVGSAGAVHVELLGKVGATLNSDYRFFVSDYAADGFGARSKYSHSSGIKGNVDNSNGAHTTVSTTLPKLRGRYTFNACLKDGSTTVRCSANVSMSF